MAANVSPRYHEVVYSGETLYNCNLIINGNLIPIDQISKIVISSPIIDKTSETFYIGTFVSQKLDITFANLDNLEINTGDNVSLSISLNVDGVYEPVQIGVYTIDELGENFYQQKSLTCLDNACKFLPAMDYSEMFTEEHPTATIEQILQYICNKVGVVLASYPNVNTNIITGAYDSTISGKQYISWIAELMGGNAKINRNGELEIIPINQAPAIQIDIPSAKKFEIGEKYSIGQVVYFDGLRNFTYPESPDSAKNVLYVRQGNLFVDSQESITNLYSALEGFEVYSITFENKGDLSLDSWDIITLIREGISYNVINHNEITYASSVMTKIDYSIPTKQQEVTTNVVKAPIEDMVRKVYTSVDNINHVITLNAEKSYTKEEIDDINNGTFNGYTTTSDATYQANKTYYRRDGDTFIQLVAGEDYNVGETIASGSIYEYRTSRVSYVETEQGRFSDEGLRIQRLDQQGKIVSETTTLFNEVGMEVNKINTETGEIEDQPILFSGFVTEDNPNYSEYKGQSITASQNIVVSNWAVLGQQSRIQDFEENGIQKTGMFPVGK